MSTINLADGPTLLQCNFVRNITEANTGKTITVDIHHETKTIVSEDLKEAQVINKIKCDMENSIFLFEITYGCKFKIDGFKNPQEAHNRVSQVGIIVLQIVIRDFLADLTRRTGQPPLLMPTVELEHGVEQFTDKPKTRKKSKK